MLAIVLIITIHISGAWMMVSSSFPCQWLTEETLRCQQTSLDEKSFSSLTNRSQIVHLEWIESGAFIHHSQPFEQLTNLRNLSLRANAITSLSLLPFWSHLTHLHHLDLSQNRLSSIHERDFRSFSNLISLNISLNFLTSIEPIWLSIPLQIIDLSRNGLNSIAYSQIQNQTEPMIGCFLREVFLNENRGLLSFVQLQWTIIDACPWLKRFQLIDNHWHCSCSDLLHALKSYRNLHLLDDQTVSLTGQCETPLNYRHLDIQKMHEELVCDRLLLLESSSTDDPSMASKSLRRHVSSLFFIGCLMGLVIGLCLHYCARRCHLLLFYILFKCERDKVTEESNHPPEIYPMSDRIHQRSNGSNYYPSTESESLPSYAQVMNDIFYLDLTHRPSQMNSSNEVDEDC